MSPQVGDGSPPEPRRRLAQGYPQAGHVLRLTCAWITKAHDKYCLVACDDAVPLLLLVNSKVHPLVASRPERKSAQLLLQGASYRFLTHDSYLDCGKVFNELSRGDICNQLAQDESRILGRLFPDDAVSVIHLVANSTTICPNEQNRIIVSLRQYLAECGLQHGTR